MLRLLLSRQSGLLFRFTDKALGSLEWSVAVVGVVAVNENIRLKSSTAVIRPFLISVFISVSYCSKCRKRSSNLFCAAATLR